MNLPNDLEKHGIKYNIPILIHNHPYSTSPFASYEDFETFAKCGVEYGIVTNDIGTFIVKNPDYEINKNKYKNIKKGIKKIKLDMIKDFENEYGVEFNEKNKIHLKNMNELVVTNHEKYFNQYHEVVSNYGMDIIFI